uniref:Uncharacterized protein n=1 Tax=Rhizophora mucronata TaxID=61149 RepID=A0A2P2QN86_RHIMU
MTRGPESHLPFPTRGKGSGTVNQRVGQRSFEYRAASLSGRRNNLQPR